jgi:hypothetical protein
VVPVCERDNSAVCKKCIQKRAHLELNTYLTVVNVIQISLRIIWIIDDESSTNAITILGLVMAVIPICTLINEEMSCLYVLESVKLDTV